MFAIIHSNNIGCIFIVSNDIVVGCAFVFDDEMMLVDGPCIIKFKFSLLVKFEA
jgi:hypothetical protein